MMAFCTWLGMFLLINFAIFALSIIFGLLFEVSMNDTSNFNYGLIVVVIIVVGIGSLIYLRFQDNPEKFGYTRIEITEG